MMPRFLVDLRHAARGLARAPGLAFGVLATFALGIGVNTAVFSAAWTLLLAPLPIAEPDRVVAIWQTDEDGDHGAAPANFLDWRREAASFSGMASYFQKSQILAGERSSRIEVAQVSSQFFDLLGLGAERGRVFHGGEDAPLAVVSDRLWRERLGSGEVVGHTIVLDGKAFEIAGITPPGFDLPDETAAWTLAPRDVAAIGLDLDLDPTTLRDARYLGVYGRLAPGVSIAEAAREMDAVAARLAAAFPEENSGDGARVVALAHDLGQPARTPLALLAAGAGCVLLVACINVAGLLVARHLGRRRELAVRKALGAGRRHLLGEALAESLLLATSGALVGLAIAAWGAPRLVAAIPRSLVAGRAVGVPPEVVAFAASIAVAAAVAVALAPTLFALRTPAASALAGHRGTLGERRERLRGGLVVAQAALAVTLVAGALLVGRTLLRTLAVDPGFAAERRLSLRLWLPAGGGLDAVARRGLLGRAVEAAATAPGVEAAGAVLKLPLTGSGFSAGARVEGHEFPAGQEPDVSWRAVTPGYFKSMGIRLLAGRRLTPADDARSEPVALVNRTLAERFWPGESAIGRRIATGIDSDDGWTTIVGVVADTPQVALTRPARPEMYRPLAQENRFGAETVVLVARTGASFSLPALERVLAAAAPQLVIDPAQPLAEVVRAAAARERVLGTLLGLFGAVALALAGLGLYGVLALAVAARRRELGLRLAVGASTRDLAALVLRKGAAQAALGVALGLPAALALGRALGSVLWGVSPADPASLAGAALALAAVAAIAAWLPARRAARVDPASVLREE